VMMLSVFSGVAVCACSPPNVHDETPDPKCRMPAL
jgi:hypothetical protein